MTERTKRYRIGLDFDGVLHSYTSGFTGETPIDLPVPGAFKFAGDLHTHGYDVFIFTARLAGSNYSVFHERKIRDWLEFYEFPIVNVPITGEKLHADLYIDDRGYRFTGDFTELSSKLFGKRGKGILMSWVSK